MKQLLCFLSCVFLCAVQISCAVTDIDPTRGAYPGPVPCTRGKDCGNTVCCLNGTCSESGVTGQKCYLSVKANGNRQPVDVWNETDVCPCIPMDYCLATSGSGYNAKYGKEGVCTPVIR